MSLELTMEKEILPQNFWINFREEFDMEGKPKTTESSLMLDEPTVTQKNREENQNFGLR